MVKNNIKLDSKRIHFIGIGGIGMSGIARVLIDMGYKVSGSDLEMNNLTKTIESLGGRIFQGHRGSNVLADTGIVVYSSSINNENPEIIEARKKDIPIVHRARILGELFNGKKGIAVTGTHGKTTTTSLISVMLYELGADPTVIVGGEVSQFRGNAYSGKGGYFVAEADESDSSFLHLKPFYAVITNIEMEHLDHYASLKDIKDAFRAFVGNIKKGGMVFYNIADENAADVIKKCPVKSETFGFTEDADIYARDIKMGGFATSFKCFYKKRLLGTVEIAIPGKHNVLNALSTILVGLKTGLKFNAIKRAIRKFDGARRRFDLRSNTNGIMLIDDYAHHPTEIKAVLSACRNWKNKRLIAVFQPHRYTRTKFLADEFGKCFDLADKLILTDIYAASEKPIKNVSIKNIYDKVVASGIKDVSIMKKKDIPAHIMKLAKKDDMVIVMGAGDIKKVSDELSAMLNEKWSQNPAYVKELKKLIKGEVVLKEPLSRHTSFRIGGPANVWVEPDNVSDLKNTISFAKTRRIPFFVIGNGSNVLASDAGFSGIVIHLGSACFKKIAIKRNLVTVGAGFSLPKLVRLACDKGLGGMESLVGIPGTLGGAIYMNAGGSTSPVYKNIGDLVSSLKVMGEDGSIRILKKNEINFGYRFSNLESYIILEARLKLDKSDKISLVASCSKFLGMKKNKQVLDLPSAGCVFKNPPDSQWTSGQMIDMLGLKGHRIGGAQIAERHANFIVNKGGATCGDVMEMIDFIQDKIKENYNITLNLEIKVI